MKLLRSITVVAVVLALCSLVVCVPADGGLGLSAGDEQREG